MHPYSELIYPARHEGKMSPKETTPPQHASITLTIATLWSLKVDVLKKSWITPCPVRDPGREGGKPGDLGLKDISQRNSPSRMLYTLFIHSLFYFFPSLSFFSYHFSSWNTLSFLSILCISADRHLSQPLNLKEAQLRCGMLQEVLLDLPLLTSWHLAAGQPLQVCGGVPLHLCVPCKTCGAGWMDDGPGMLLS